jgi:hypothetical protein
VHDPCCLMIRGSVGSPKVAFIKFQSARAQVGQRAAQLLAMPPQQLLQWTAKQQHTVVALVRCSDQKVANRD